MKIVCISVGKKHDDDIAKAINDYTARLQRYAFFEWQVLPPVKGKLSIDETKRAESAVIATQLKNDDHIVLLDEGGVELTSNGLASMLDELAMQAPKRVLFVIGGAFGVTDELKQRANIVWSLSKLTFPHQLVRLIFIEQLYRAHTIRRGEPYHHN